MLGEDGVLNIPTKFCVVVDEKPHAYYHELKIRKIHRFGNLVWFGIPKIVDYLIYDKDEVRSIMTIDAQYIVPRQAKSLLYNARVVYSKKSIYNLKAGDKLKELVIENGKPKLIDYKLEKFTSLSDEGRGIKGYLYVPNSNMEIIVK